MESYDRKTKIFNHLKKGTILIVPFLLFITAVFLATLWVFKYVIAESAYFSFAVNNQIVTNSEPVTTSLFSDGLEVPVIKYESKWATLNVDGWKTTDISVYYGDNDTILKKGAGFWNGSNFCGENGKIVISAHVNRYFKEIEETKVSTEVTMDTVYGKFVYKVKEVVIFANTDPTVILPTEGEGEQLVLYTCYPYDNNGRARTERIALICEKSEGWLD